MELYRKKGESPLAKYYRAKAEAQYRKKQQPQAGPSAQPQTNQPGWAARTAATVADPAVQVAKGATRGMEGVFDWVSSLFSWVPAAGAKIGEWIGGEQGAKIGGNLGNIAQLLANPIGIANPAAWNTLTATWDKGTNTTEAMKERAQIDFTNKATGWLDPVTEASFLSDSKLGQFAQEGLQSIGQMLPSIALTAMTGGAAGQALGTAMFSAGAGGQSMQQAYDEGATPGKGFAYGTLSGAAEGAIERISGGIGGTKAGQVLGKQLGKSTLGKLGINFVSEGLEEVASDALDPVLRKMTGTTDRSWGDLYQEAAANMPKSFLMGGAVGSVMGGAGRAIQAKKAGGLNNLNAMERAQALTEETPTLNVREAQGKDTVRSEKYIADIKNRLSKNLKNMDADTRANFFAANPSIAGHFEADGSVRQAKITNSAAVSPALRGQTTQYAPTQQELTPKVKEALNDAVRLTDGKVNYVVTDELTEGVNGYYDKTSQTMYLSAKLNEADVPRAVISHEITHSLEGTESYGKLAEYVMQRIKGNSKYVPENYLAAYAKAHKGVSAETLQYIVQTEMVADYVANELLTNEQAVRKLVQTHESLARRIYNWIKEKLSLLTKNSADRETARDLSHALKLYEKALRDSVGGVSLEAVEGAVTARNDKNGKAGEQEGKTRAAGKTLVEGTGRRFSLQKSFAEQVDDVLNGKQSQTIDLYVSETPDTFVKLGFSKTPMLMRSGKITEILEKHTEMTVDLITQIPEAIREPLLILKSKTNPDVSVVAITEIMTEKGEMIVPVWVNQDGVYLDLELEKPVAATTNFVASAYGRDVKALIEYAVEHDGFLFANADMKKVNDLLTRHGLRLPRPLRIADSTISIPQKEDLSTPEGKKDKDIRFSLSQAATEAQTITQKIYDQLKLDYDLTDTDLKSITSVIKADVQKALGEKNKRKGLYHHLYKEIRKKYYEELLSFKYRNRILNTARTAKDMLGRKEYVSAKILENADLKGYLKFIADLKGGASIKGDVRQRVAALKKVYNADNFTVYDDNAVTGSDIDARIAEAIDFIAVNADSKAALTADELKALDIITKGILHLYKNYDVMYRGETKVSVRETAERGINVLKKTAKRKQRSGVIQTVCNKLTEWSANILDPTSVLRQLDGYESNGVMTELFNDVQRGEVTAAIHEIRLTEAFEQFFQENKGYAKRLAETRVTVNGEELTLDQAIYVYLLSKREAAHLYESGIMVTDKRGMTRKVEVTEGDIGDIEKALTETDKAYVELVHTFFNKDARALKEETDQKLYGYTVMEEGSDYVPIYRDKAGIAMKMGDPKGYLNDVAAAYSQSFNKATNNSKLPIAVYAVTDVVTRHARGIAMYAGLAIPIRNFNRVYNAVDETSGTSMRETMNHGIWKGAERYLRKLFDDVQGIGKPSSGYDKALNKIRGAYAKYQLGANVKTVLAQTASYPMAFVYLDADCLMKALAMKADKAAMFEYAPMTEQRMRDRAVVKAQSLSDKVGKVGDIATKPIQMMDNATVRRLWAACQLQVQKHDGHKIGSKENLTAAGELLDKVVRETQSNYLTTERSAMNRSHNFLASSMTMFMSDATKQFSRLFDAVGELAVRKAEYTAQATETNKAAYTKAKKKLGRAVTAVVMSNLHYVLIGELIKWLFDKLDDEDKDGKVIDEYLADFGKEFGSMLEENKGASIRTTALL